MIKCEKGNVSINVREMKLSMIFQKSYLVPTVPSPKHSERKKQSR
mgnify:CR=1 FL=1